MNVFLMTLTVKKIKNFINHTKMMQFIKNICNINLYMINDFCKNQICTKKKRFNNNNIKLIRKIRFLKCFESSKIEFFELT
jgi:hypothetical protein